MRFVVLLLALSGAACSNTRILEKYALRNDHRADVYAQTGRPDKAAAARYRADSMDLTAKLRSEGAFRQHFTWVGM